MEHIALRLRGGLYVLVGASVAVGLVTGIAVAGLHWVIVDAIWNRLETRTQWWIALLPVAALLASSAVVFLTRDRSTATTEDYIRVFHDPAGHVRARAAPLRLLASVATIALGGSMGLEGPSIYLGSVLGDVAERRMRSLVSEDDRKVLLIAGAAAGIAAIFKAPVTGVVFALEVPYRDDLARRALIPSIFAAAAAYVVFVAAAGTTPLFRVAAAPLRFVDLAGAVAVGLGCGIGARLFAFLYHVAVDTSRRLAFWLRPVGAGLCLVVIGAIALHVYGAALPLGPGYNAIRLATRGQLGVGLLAALFVLKLFATTATAAGNGVGGLFFPSVLMGATVGAAFGHFLPGPSSLFAVVGIAAFIGGVYNVPLAGVAFVAEATGAPSYIIPGLIAAALAYIASGQRSLSDRQRSRRLFDIEMRLDATVADAMSHEWVEVPPTATLREFATIYAVRARSRTVPVAESGRFIGMISLASLGDVAVEAWDATPVTALMRDDLPLLSPQDTLRWAAQTMQSSGIDRLAVAREGRIVGTLMTTDIVRFEQLIDSARNEHRRGLDA
jgi:CIC family chloride channel protein